MSKRSRYILLILKRLILDLIRAILVAGTILVTGEGIKAVANIWGIGSGMLRVVTEIIALSFMVLAAMIFVYNCLVSCYKAIADLTDSKTGSSFRGILTPGKRAEKWAIALGWWIPRKYREDIVGDILEDCNEMRDKSCGEWRIRIQVIWQWSIAVLTLVPAAFFGGIWRIFSPLK